jgi:glycosyltransferase involved in cell wall biosynthesis
MYNADMISFIIPTLNEEKTIEATLKCISGYLGEYEIILSDGNSKKVAREIISDPREFSKLAEGLSEKDSVVRARTCDAIEFVSRYKPELCENITSQLVKLATYDSVDMVRWHIAMIFANLSYNKQTLKKIILVLYQMLEDKSNMVKPWAISTLTILCKRYPETKLKTIFKMRPLIKSKKVSVANRSKKAIETLVNNQPLPKGWQKTSSIIF